MFTNPSFDKHCFNLSPSFQFLVNKFFYFCRGAEAQLVEAPSKAAVSVNEVLNHCAA